MLATVIGSVSAIATAPTGIRSFARMTTTHSLVPSHFISFHLAQSVCDIVVFSNTSGVDIFQRCIGTKLHEAVHCVLALVSASTVIYNQFPEEDES